MKKPILSLPFVQSMDDDFLTRYPSKGSTDNFRGPKLPPLMSGKAGDRLSVDSTRSSGSPKDSSPFAGQMPLKFSKPMFGVNFTCHNLDCYKKPFQEDECHPSETAEIDLYPNKQNKLASEQINKAKKRSEEELLPECAFDEEIKKKLSNSESNLSWSLIEHSAVDNFIPKELEETSSQESTENKAFY
jgi:hypothetical protein